MEYGKVITKGFTELGELFKIEENIVEGALKSPISRTIEERVKVTSAEEEVEQYQAFSEMIHSDKHIMSPEFRIEHSRRGDREGYYYVIKSYTRLERF